MDMFTKEIEVCGDKYKFRFDAYFPIFYNELMSEDFFAANRLVTENGDNVAADKIAYASARYADDNFTMSLREWLERYDIASFVELVYEVITFLRSTSKQAAVSKKK